MPLAQLILIAQTSTVLLTMKISTLATKSLPGTHATTAPLAPNNPAEKATCQRKNIRTFTTDFAEKTNVPVKTPVPLAQPAAEATALEDGATTRRPSALQDLAASTGIATMTMSQNVKKSSPSLNLRKSTGTHATPVRFAAKNSALKASATTPLVAPIPPAHLAQIARVASARDPSAITRGQNAPRVQPASLVATA